MRGLRAEKSFISIYKAVFRCRESPGCPWSSVSVSAPSAIMIGPKDAQAENIAFESLNTCNLPFVVCFE
jgi:hypothetical protein